MARVKLTAGRIRDFALRPGQQQSFLWDTDAPWLAIRAVGVLAITYLPWLTLVLLDR